MVSYVSFPDSVKLTTRVLILVVVDDGLVYFRVQNVRTFANKS